MDSPAQTRVGSAPTGGIIAQPGVAAFRQRFADPSSAEHFFNWTNQKETRLALAAIRDLAMNGPVGMANPPNDYLVQYGMTVGLNLAAQIIEDPSLVFPELFQGRKAVHQEAPQATFDASAV